MTVMRRRRFVPVVLSLVARDFGLRRGLVAGAAAPATAADPPVLQVHTVDPYYLRQPTPGPVPPVVLQFDRGGRLLYRANTYRHRQDDNNGQSATERPPPSNGVTRPEYTGTT